MATSPTLLVPITKLNAMKQVLFLFITLCSLSQLYAQRVVKGHVTDAATNSGLPGVSVAPKGAGGGTTTNSNGDFTIQVSGNEAVLVFSFVGFVSQEVP